MVIAELVSLLGFRVNDAGARQFDAQMQNLQRNANGVAAGISAAFAGAAIAITAGIGAAIGAALGNIPKAGDEMTTAIAKIKSSLGDSAIVGGEAVAVYEKLYEIGLKTGVSAAESAQGFTQLQLAMKDMNYGAGETVELLEGLQSAGVVAGQSAQDVTEAIRQLGQAFGKGKLNGDELVSLSERMPRFLREVQKEMNMTPAQFFDASSKGKLTPELLAPALLKAGKRASEELANFPTTMAAGYRRLQLVMTRFLADLDKQFEISQNLARVFVYISRVIDGWRSGLNVVGDIVRELGGLEAIARIVGIALLVAFAGNIVSALSGLTAMFMALGRVILVSLLPLAGFAAWVLIIEDFVSWMQGKDSLFGRKFGDFQTVIDGIKEQIAPFKQWFTENFDFSDMLGNTRREFEGIRDFFSELWETIKTKWNENVAGMKPQIDWLLSVGGLLMEAFRPLGEFFAGVFNVILNNINAFYDRVMVVVNGIRGAVSGLLGLIPGLQGATEGAGTGTDPAGQEQRRRNFGARGGLGGFVSPELADDISRMLAPLPDVTGRTGGNTNNVNAPQTNTITNDITINAPGSDPASVAAATSSGVNRAMGLSIEGLRSAALGVTMASPRIESPAMP